MSVSQKKRDKIFGIGKTSPKFLKCVLSENTHSRKVTQKMYGLFFRKFTNFVCSLRSVTSCVYVCKTIKTFYVRLHTISGVCGMLERKPHTFFWSLPPKINYNLYKKLRLWCTWSPEFLEMSQIREITFSRNPGKFRKFPENPGNSPENTAGKFGVFSYFQAVIAYKRL